MTPPFAAVTALVVALCLPSSLQAAGRCDQRARFYAWPAGTTTEHVRAWVHHFARAEGVDPLLLEAIARHETGLRPARGRCGEVSAFQIMPRWASVFGLPGPEWLWDLRVSATAAARIVKHAESLWDPRLAGAGANLCLRNAGWRGPLTRPGFVGMVYNWGGAARRLRDARDPARVRLPAGPCRYAVRLVAKYNTLRGASRPASGE